MRMALRWMWLAGRLALALCTAGLGVVELVSQDFIGRWQPLPPGLPGRQALVWVSGLVLLACGAGLTRRQTMRIAALVLASFLLLWVLALHVPPLVAAPADVRRWLYLGEVLAIACGALMLWAPPGQEVARVAVRGGFALCLITFGSSHFSDLKLVASVVPTYVPAPMAVAGLTGAAHLAAAAALLLNVLPRLAATLEAAMMSVFVLLVNVPEVCAHPAQRGAWITLLAEGALVGAAWLVAAALAGPTVSSATRRPQASAN